VAGGGDSAVEEAIYLTKFARRVTIIHRRDELRAARSIQERAFKNEKIHFLWNSVVHSVDGDGLMDTLTVKNTKTGELTTSRPTRTTECSDCSAFWVTCPIRAVRGQA
jgi:thioredoxin reductase (NADPH)